MSEDTISDPKEALKRAVQLHREGKLTEADEAYQEVLKLDPEQPDALHLLGVMSQQLGNPETAVELIQQSLQVNEKQPGAYNNLGNVYVHQEAWSDAERCYRRAVELAPDYVEAQEHLGHVLFEQKRGEEALACYAKVLEAVPERASTHFAMGAVRTQQGELDAAVACYRQGLEHQSDSILAHRKLGNLLRQLGRLDDAAAVYEQWLSLAPENPWALHFKAVCGRGDVPKRAADDFIKVAFDGFSPEFSRYADADYQVPQLLTRAAEAVLDKQQSVDILDLGCGDGLCARPLKKYASSLTGVDLSPFMVKQAEGEEDEDSLYDSVREADIVDFLAVCNGDYDLLVAGDVLPYLGPLRDLFRRANVALRDNGRLVFTVEQLEADGDYELHRFGRFAHGRDYLVRELEAAEFTVQEIDSAVLRKEGDQPVAGYVVTAVKRAQADWQEEIDEETASS